MAAEPTCSFCKRRVGEGWRDNIERAVESGEITINGERLDASDILARLAKHPDRKVRMLMPGPGDLAICDVCIDLYSDAVRREDAARG